MEGSNLVFVIAGPLDTDVAQLAIPAMRAYLDLPVTAETPVVAAQAILKFLQKMGASQPVDHFSKGKQGWWKIEVPQDVWNGARAELADLVQGKSDPSQALERTADDLFRHGKYAEALTGYGAAAAAAVPEGKTPLSARFKETMGKFRDLAAQLTLSSPTPAQTTQVGKPFTTTFDVKLTYGSGNQAPPVTGVPLRFSYLAKINGRLATTGQTIRTDESGMVRFELPIPNFSARDSVVVVVDTSAWLDSFSAVPQDLRESVSKVETTAGDRKLQLPYIVESASKLVPMTVALADFDDKGSILRRQDSTPALINALQKAGFQVSGIQVNPSLLKSSNDGVILTAWKFQGKSQGRAVYGTVNLVSVTSADSQFSAEVAGVLKVVDLATSKPVYQLKSSKVALAADKATAISQGFRQWAVDAAAELADELP